jgi:hypothetical protein
MEVLPEFLNFGVLLFSSKGVLRFGDSLYFSGIEVISLA